MTGTGVVTCGGGSRRASSARRAGVMWAALAISASGCGLHAWRSPGPCEVAPARSALARGETRAVTAAITSAEAAQSTRGEIVSAGPRFGLFWVTRDLLLSLEYEHEAEPPITAWGWQFEYQLETSAGGPTGLVEIVPMLAGLEWGLTLFSVSAFAGLRFPGGAEALVGPYYSATSNTVGLGVALGYTFRVGDLNLPVNISATRNNNGERYGFTVGFNMRR